MILKSLLVLLLLFSAAALITPWRFHSQGQVKGGQDSGESIKEKLKKQFPIVDSFEPEPADPQERTKRQKRSEKFNEQRANVGPQLVQSAQGYHWPADFKPIPISVSDLVIVGTISDARAHLSEDKNSIYSEFSVTINAVLKNGPRLSLVSGDSITLEREGGRVRYPSGHISWFFVIGQGLPQLNGQYVLFLKAADEERLFDILTGYQILDGRIEPLDDSPGVVHFERYSGSDATAFVNEIRRSITSAQPRSFIGPRVTYKDRSGGKYISNRYDHRKSNPRHLLRRRF